MFLQVSVSHPVQEGEGVCLGLGSFWGCPGGYAWSQVHSGRGSLVPGTFWEGYPWYQVSSGDGYCLVPGPLWGYVQERWVPTNQPPPTLWTGDLGYPPTAPSATDGRYASYWNAFLLMCSSTNQNASWTRVDVYWNLLLRGSGDFYISKSQSGNILW